MSKVHLSTHYNDIDLNNQFTFNSRTSSLVVVTRDLLLFVSRVEFQSVHLLLS